MARGRFITLEGGEGTGKTTQARRLAEALAADGTPVLLTREPGGSPGADTLRALLLGGSVSWAPLAETLLHFAARADHIARTIRPALEAGAWVICDRYYDSTMVYQGDGLGADKAAIATLSSLMDLVPDLTLMLDVPIAVTEARLKARGGEADRYESLGADFFVRIRAGFQALAAAHPARFAVHDATGTPDEITAALLATVRARLA